MHLSQHRVGTDLDSYKSSAEPFYEKSTTFLCIIYVVGLWILYKVVLFIKVMGLGLGPIVGFPADQLETPSY